MPYVNVPKDLSTVRVRILFGLSKRQLICFSLAAATGIPTYLVTRGAIGNSAAVVVMIAVMLPAFFMAMFEKDGQPAEKVLRNFIRARFLWPGVRVYKTENLYQILTERGEPIANKNKKSAKAK
jgi:hypothetical protein